ncbi:unnamed protein product [Chrysodeixis includens]|uniref:Phospholipase D-like domain-containing protein n=1 Tax=Chrysodeixis includens TaxID=689277 RepID=A0A9N8PWQ3_CHRIL|nr:unnamed protein product [Chrysodeixis includens]
MFGNRPDDKLNNKQNDSAINEILLYGAETEEQTKQIGLDNLLCIYYVILHANKTVDVCVPSLISGTLAECLINVRQKNKARVRITIHNSDEFHNLQSFAENGIEVKVISPSVRLEHEFVLVDLGSGPGEAVGVLGALDYDTARPNCNRDATLLSSDVTLLTALGKEFERVWNYAPETTEFKLDNNNSDSI